MWRRKLLAGLGSLEGEFMRSRRRLAAGQEF